MSIPPRKGRGTPPNPPPDRKTSLSMSDFQYQGFLEDQPNTTVTRVMRHSDTDKAVARLREKRLRFTKQIPIDHASNICSPRDRRAALEVYDEAIEKICDTNHLQVNAEADSKIRLILGIAWAHPSASVFQNKQILSPLDPAYAKPRIEYSDDPHSYHQSWRLQEWRKDGWPDSYPGWAIGKERSMQGEPKTWRDQDWSEPNELIQGRFVRGGDLQ